MLISGCIFGLLYKVGITSVTHTRRSKVTELPFMFDFGRGVLVRLGMVVCGLLICMVVELTTFTTMDHSLLTELPVCFSSRSRSTHITRYNNRWIILSDGSGEGVNANPVSIFGVVCDHFQWSMSSQFGPCSCGFILSDGYTYLNSGLGTTWSHNRYGVAYCFYILLFIDLSCVIIIFVEEYMVFSLREHHE